MQYFKASWLCGRAMTSFPVYHEWVVTVWQATAPVRGGQDTKQEMQCIQFFPHIKMLMLTFDHNPFWLYWVCMLDSILQCLHINSSFQISLQEVSMASASILSQWQTEHLQEISKLTNLCHQFDCSEFVLRCDGFKSPTGTATKPHRSGESFTFFTKAWQMLIDWFYCAHLKQSLLHTSLMMIIIWIPCRLNC